MPYDTSAWRKILVGTAPTALDALVTPAGSLIVVGGSGGAVAGAQRSSNSGTTFTPSAGVAGLTLNAGVAFAGALYALQANDGLTTPPAIYTSADDGLTWSLVATPTLAALDILGNGPGVNGGGCRLVNLNNGILYLVGFQSEVVNSLPLPYSGDGIEWFGDLTPPNATDKWQINLLAHISGSLMAMHVIRVPATPSVGELYYSSDAGNTWTLAQALNIPVYAMRVMNGNVYVGAREIASKSSIYRSTDNGQTYTQVWLSPETVSRRVTDFIEIVGVELVAIETLEGGVSRILRSTDDGVTWAVRATVTTNGAGFPISNGRFTAPGGRIVLTGWSDLSLWFTAATEAALEPKTLDCGHPITNTPCVADEV